MYYLLRTPAALQKLLKEISDADEGGELSTCITGQEAGKLRYFQACMKEALREFSLLTGACHQ
jgi:hypothetical protein